MREKKYWITVEFRRKHSDDEFGMTMAYPLDGDDAGEMVRKAVEHMEEDSRIYTTLEYKIGWRYF